MWAVFKIQGFVCKRFLPSFPSIHRPVILCFRTAQKRLLRRLAAMLRAGYAVRRDNKDNVLCIPRSLSVKASLSNFIDKRLTFVCYNILRSLIHEPKQAHYALHFFSCIYYSLRTAYRVASYLDNFLSCMYHSLRTAYRVASY